MSEVLNFIIDVASTWTERNGSPPEELVMHPRVFSTLKNFHSELQGAYGYPSGISQVGGMKVKVDPNLAEDEIIFRSGLITQRMYVVNKKKFADRFKKKRLIRVKI